MKRFSYKWSDDYFILHIQLNHSGDRKHEVIMTRQYDGDTVRNEIIKTKKEPKSHRFMISRSHPKERGFFIDYSENIVLEAFKVADRANYPGNSFYRE